MCEMTHFYVLRDSDTRIQLQGGFRRDEDQVLRGVHVSFLCRVRDSNKGSYVEFVTHACAYNCRAVFENQVIRGFHSSFLLRVRDSKEGSYVEFVTYFHVQHS